MCKDRIEKIVKSIVGISSAEWNISNKLFQVNYDAGRTNTEKIQKIVADSGHYTELYRAKDEVYNSLPECCKYRLSK